MESLTEKNGAALRKICRCAAGLGPAAVVTCAAAAAFVLALTRQRPGRTDIPEARCCLEGCQLRQSSILKEKQQRDR